MLILFIILLIAGILLIAFEKKLGGILCLIAGALVALFGAYGVFTSFL